MKSRDKTIKSTKKGSTKNQLPPPATICITMDRQPKDVADIYTNMTLPVSEKLEKKQKNLIQGQLYADQPIFEKIKWVGKNKYTQFNVNELIIFAHGAYFDHQKYVDAHTNAANETWLGKTAGHMRKPNEAGYTNQKDRHIGEYRLDEIAHLIIQIIRANPNINTVKFYVCETGQTYKFPQQIISTNDEFEFDLNTSTTAYSQNTKRDTANKDLQFKRKVPVAEASGQLIEKETYNQTQKEISRNTRSLIWGLYFDSKFEGKKLNDLERDEYLADFTNAEIIVALVDKELKRMEKQEKISASPFIIFKAPTGLMDVRRVEPKYRAFDRKHYDEVANGNDEIADERSVVSAVRYVLGKNTVTPKK